MLPQALEPTGAIGPAYLPSLRLHPQWPQAQTSIHERGQYYSLVLAVALGESIKRSACQTRQFANTKRSQIAIQAKRHSAIERRMAQHL